MATASDRRQRVRPIVITSFCDKILILYKPTPQNKRYTVYYRIRRVTTFLARHPAVKTTADLKASLIPEFVGSCRDISESTLIATLKHFRRICNLAIEWGCLKRNPFEGYLFPKTPSRSFSRAPRGRKLDEGQVRDILAYLKDGADPWKGHRLYAFTAAIVYAGLQASEALELRCADCNLDRQEIRVLRRAKFTWSMYHPVVKVPPALVKILTVWFARRRRGTPAYATQIRYGTRLADDGKSLIPDEAEQGVLADMRRWRGEGWSLKRIARELDSRGVPTKLGRAKRWHHGSVDVILKREAHPGGNSAAKVGEDLEKEGILPDDDPGWAFPNVSGKGRWQRTDAPGYSALDQIRSVGITLGIEGLTLESLRRFYLENARPTLDPGWDGLESRDGRAGPAREKAPPDATAGGKRPDPVPWSGSRAELEREIDSIASEATRDVVRKLIELMPAKPTKIALEKASGRGDAVNLLKRFADSGSRLARAVGLPGRGKQGYWIDVVARPLKMPVNP